MKDGVLLGTADADHGIHPAAFSGGTVPDAHLIRTKQRQQSLGRYGGAGDQPVAFQLFRRRAVQERRKGCGTAYNDRCAGKVSVRLLPVSASPSSTSWRLPSRKKT